MALCGPGMLGSLHGHVVQPLVCEFPFPIWPQGGVRSLDIYIYIFSAKNTLPFETLSSQNARF